jgi:hypothetical protein
MKHVLSFLLICTPFWAIASLKEPDCMAEPFKNRTSWLSERADVYFVREMGKGKLTAECTCSGPFSLSCEATIKPQHISKMIKNTTDQKSFTYTYTGRLDTPCNEKMKKIYEDMPNRGEFDIHYFLKKSEGEYFTQVPLHICPQP